MLKIRHACYYVGIPAIVQDPFSTHKCAYVISEKKEA